MLEMQILNVLVGEMTGLQIGKAIQAEYGKDPGLSITTVLWRMTDQGLVSRRAETGEEKAKRIAVNGDDRAGARRFFYSKTGKGGTWLKEQELKQMSSANPAFGI